MKVQSSRKKGLKKELQGMEGTEEEDVLTAFFVVNNLLYLLFCGTSKSTTPFLDPHQRGMSHGH